MQRFLVVVGTSLFCGLLTGCAGDPRIDAVNGVVQYMNASAGDVENITREVKKAIEKYEKEKTPFDLTDAAKAAKSLEDTGTKVVDFKVKRVDMVKPATEEEKAEYAKEFRSKIAQPFDNLTKAKAALNEALQKADAIDKEKTDELRKKVRQAEGPFETLDRQQG